MTLIDFRQKLKDKISEITEFAEVLDYFSTENYTFPSAFVLASNFNAESLSRQRKPGGYPAVLP